MISKSPATFYGLATYGKNAHTRGQAFAFASMCATALAIIAKVDGWGGLNTKAKAVDVVKELREDYVANMPKTTAYRMVSNAAGLARKLRKELANTLEVARTAEGDGEISADEAAVAHVVASLKALNVANLSELEAWISGKSEEKPAKAFGERVAARLQKAAEDGEMTPTDFATIIAKMLELASPAELDSIAANVPAAKAARERAKLLAEEAAEEARQRLNSVMGFVPDARNLVKSLRVA
jgi:hypothetical protein